MAASFRDVGENGPGVKHGIYRSWVVLKSGKIETNDIEEGTCWDEHWVSNWYGNQFDNKYLI